MLKQATSGYMAKPMSANQPGALQYTAGALETNMISRTGGVHSSTKMALFTPLGDTRRVRRFSAGEPLHLQKLGATLGSFRPSVHAQAVSRAQRSRSNDFRQLGSNHAEFTGQKHAYPNSLTLDMSTSE